MRISTLIMLAAIGFFLYGGNHPDEAMVAVQKFSTWAGHLLGRMIG